MTLSHASIPRWFNPSFARIAIALLSMAIGSLIGFFSILCLFIIVFWIKEATVITGIQIAAGSICFGLVVLGWSMVTAGIHALMGVWKTDGSGGAARGD